MQDHTNHIYRDVTEALPNLMHALLANGEETGSRNGRTKELINNRITLTEPWRREILLPSRKASIAAQIAETMWVLNGSNDIEWLGRYLPRAKDFSDDGKTWRGGYGPRIRAYRAPLPTGSGIDQLERAVDMLRADPLTRQAVIDISDMTVDCRPGKDIPCTRSLQFLSRNGHLHLTVTMRSNDAMWGFSGINAFEWSTLQEIVAAMLGLRVGTLVFNAGSFHLYENHWTKAEKIVGDTFLLDDLTTLAGIPFDWSAVSARGWTFDDLLDVWFHAEMCIREGSTLAPRLVSDFPEPMFQAWLRVIQWYWSGDLMYLDPLVGTRLRGAVLVSAPIPVSKEGDLCPRCGTTMTTSGGRTPLVCIAAACRYEPVRSEAPTASSGADAGVTAVVGAIVQQIASGNYGPLDLSKQPDDPFVAYVTNLHDEKHAAYGDSWKRRGEMLGIMANLARKVDRLGVNGAGDTAADTAIDLLVYLAKYQTWLADQQIGPGYIVGTEQSEDPERANEIIRLIKASGYGNNTQNQSTGFLEEILTEGLDHLEVQVAEGNSRRWQRVQIMTRVAYVLAERLWNETMTSGDYRGADSD